MRDDETGECDSIESRVERLLGERAWGELAETLGFEVVRERLPPSACDAWGFPRGVVDQTDRLEVLAAGEGYRLVLAEGVDDYGGLRRAMLAAYRRNPSECLIWWLVGEETVTVALADANVGGRPYVRRMETHLDEPDPVGLRQWGQLDLSGRVADDVTDPAEGVARHVTEVLRQEKLTREFFDGFREALELLVSEMRDGPDDDQARHDVALATLLRLVFLYFLQQRGALDGDRRFVLRRYRRACDEGRPFYAEVLRPLYFEVLNRASGERSRAARQLGEIPFLNGGLFEPLPAEVDHPNLGWDNEVWAEIVEGLFERFHFTVDEGIGPDENRAVDPEMLGKVFEGLMYGERRHESGSFYTPRDVVREVVTDAIAMHLADETGIDRSVVSEVVSGERIEFDGNQKRAVRGALESFHLLDPAVGTGAFLLESLRVLERLYRAAEMERESSPYRRRRAIIHRHLFGVDLQQTAVRICALRLWLALLSVMPDEWSAEEIPPLPNLAHRVACGNSLVAPSDRVRLGSVSEVPGRWQFESLDRLETDHRDRMREMQHAYLEAHGERKAELRRAMESLERDLERRLLEARRSRLQEKLEPYERLENSNDLFGEAVDLDPAQRRAKERLQDESAALADAIEDLEEGRAAAGGFHYAARFGAAMEESGFDVIVTNPPWIRANRLESSTRDLLKKRYRSFSNDLWEGADELGIQVPFGVQVDVAAVFVERCFELLRPGGQLGALLPAKLFRSLHGSGLRGLLAEHELRALCDYSEAEREMFDATVYPATIQARKNETSAETARRPRRRSPRPPERSFDLTIWRGRERDEWRADAGDLPARTTDLREPWLLVPPDVSEVFDRMWASSTPLGGVESLQPRRGIMTGRNDVFLFDEGRAHEELGAAADDWTRPVLSGRDIEAWNADSERRIVWPYDDQLQLVRDLPASVVEYFEAHREALENRADYNPNRPIWQLFRMNSGVTDPKVVWRDLAPKLEAAPAEAGVVPLNTVYFIPFETASGAERMAEFLNSEPVRAYAFALAERARGGWRRHFAWLMRMLPVPDALVRELQAGDGPSAEESSMWRRADDTASAFGIDEHDFGALRDWRTAECGTSAREAA